MMSLSVYFIRVTQNSNEREKKPNKQNKVFTFRSFFRLRKLNGKYEEKLWWKQQIICCLLFQLFEVQTLHWVRRVRVCAIRAHLSSVRYQKCSENEVGSESEKIWREKNEQKHTESIEAKEKPLKPRLNNVRVYYYVIKFLLLFRTLMFKMREKYWFTLETTF